MERQHLLQQLLILREKKDLSEVERKRLSDVTTLYQTSRMCFWFSAPLIFFAGILSNGTTPRHMVMNKVKKGSIWFNLL
jgi:hypothetical protein